MLKGHVSGRMPRDDVPNRKKDRDTPAIQTYLISDCYDRKDGKKIRTWQVLFLVETSIDGSYQES